MEALWEKLGVVIAALVSALGGWYVYDRKTTHDRFSKIEESVNKNTLDIAVIEVRFDELKADNSEMKQSLKDIIELLTRRRK